MVFEEYQTALRTAFLPSLILGLLERHQTLTPLVTREFLRRIGIEVASPVLNRIMQRLAAAGFCTVEKGVNEFGVRDGRRRTYRANVNTGAYRALFDEDLEDFKIAMADILKGKHHSQPGRGSLI